MTIATVMRRTPAAVVLLSVVLFYGWLSSAGLPFEVGKRHDGYYNLLTDALLHGQLHLRQEPRAELFELADPYLGPRNERYRLQDASLYRGKYYLYFGVAPAITFFAPGRLLGLGDLPQSLAVFCFASGGLVFGVLLVRRLAGGTREAGAREPPSLATSPWVWAAAVGVLGFANVAPYLLRRPSVYEVAVSAGLFFLAASAWLFLTAARDGAPSLSRLALGSLLLGCAVGSRPNHLVALPFLLLLAWPALRRSGRLSRSALAAALAPLGLVLLLLGLYNKARFGAWGEFGVSYVLTGTRVRFLDLPALPPALYFHFIGPAALRAHFPFVFPDDRYPWTCPTVFFNEPTAGILWHSPFLLALLVTPWLLRQTPSSASPPWLRSALVLAGLGLASPLLTNLAFPAVAMRYQMDFATFLAVPALALWLRAERRTTGRTRAAIRALAAVTMAWSCLTMAAMSFSGDDAALRVRNPRLFAALERGCEPLRIAFGRVFQPRQRMTVRFRAALPERLAADQEPLLSSGGVDRHDLLWLRQVAPGRWRLALAPAAGGTRISREFLLAPNVFHAFELELDRIVPRLVVRVDGLELAEIRSALEPLDESKLELGRGPRGRGARDLGHFSGTLLSERFLAAGAPGLESPPAVASRPAVFSRAGDPPPAQPVQGQLWVRADRPGAYLFCDSGWRWIPRHALDRVVIERPLSSAGPAGLVEPVVFSGDSAAGDAVFLRRLAGGRSAFGVARWDGRGWSLGPTGSPQPASPRARPLRVTLDRPAGLVLVELDGVPALRSAVALGPIPSGGLRTPALVGSGFPEAGPESFSR